MINLNALLKMSGVKRYAQNAVIAREGDSTNNDMFIVVHGRAGVYKDYQLPGERMTGALSPGEFLGEMTLFADKTRTETIVAITEMVAVGVNRQNLAELFTMQPELGFSIVETICKRLDELSKEHNSLLLETGRITEQVSTSASSPLFPEKHGNYTLEINNSSDCLYTETITCPLCGNSFKNLSLISSRLRRISSDPDMRARYKDIEPMHYEVITCPSCLFSTQSENFATTSKKFWQNVFQELSPYMNEKHKLKSGEQRDTFSVFAGYYLALLCAPVCFDEHQLITASLWQKLSRLYDDCADEEMNAYAVGRALKDYTYAYEHFTLTDRKEQQVGFMLGILCQKTGDLDKARNYFFQLKSNNLTTPIMKRQAELRLDEIKELKKKQGG